MASSVLCPFTHFSFIFSCMLSSFVTVSAALLRTGNSACPADNFGVSNSSVDGTLGPGYMYIQSEPSLPCGGTVYSWKFCYHVSNASNSQFTFWFVILRRMYNSNVHFGVVGANSHVIFGKTAGRNCITRKANGYPIHFEAGDLLATSVYDQPWQFSPLAYRLNEGRLSSCFFTSDTSYKSRIDPSSGHRWVDSDPLTSTVIYCNESTPEFLLGKLDVIGYTTDSNHNPVNSFSSSAGLVIGLTTAVFAALTLPFVVVGGVACVVWMKKSRRPLVTWDQL